jgi:hypothetical protein
MMIGIGTPSSQSRIPRPIVVSIRSEVSFVARRRRAAPLASAVCVAAFT